MNVRSRIKVCGMIDMVDVENAVAAGVDALGFIFAEASPRKIEPEKARELISRLPPFVDAVGVFVNEDVEVVHEIAQYCGLTILQLHGEESPEYCQGFSRRVVKSFGVGPGFDPAVLLPYAGIVSGFLLDTYHEKLAGGTGQVFDWSILDTVTAPGPVILAGGLTPENVGAAILRTRPFAVDANSGVEISPGRKDPLKVRQLVAEVARVDTELAGE